MKPTLNQKKETMMTVVFDRDGDELERMDGIVEVCPWNYQESLPIKVVYLKLTSEVIAVHTIKK